VFPGPADDQLQPLDQIPGLQQGELLLRGQAERGTTLVLVTHDAALAARCNRVLHMRSGHIEARAPAESRIG